MRGERSHGGCLAIRLSSSSSSSSSSATAAAPPSPAGPTTCTSRCYHTNNSVPVFNTADEQTRRWIERSLSCVCIKRKGSCDRIYFNITPLQEERVQRLKNRMVVDFDSERREHQDALKALWQAAFPDKQLDGLVSEQWKEMGWQGRDPSTDFRGAGYISLENLLFFAKTFSNSFKGLLNKQDGERATWEYPFAAAGVNITFMIMQMLDLHSTKRSFVKSVFIQMLSENEWAFDLLYSVAFMIMDKQWLAKNASYMQFNEVLRCTRAQLEKELLLGDVVRIEDMPSYSLLS